MDTAIITAIISAVTTLIVSMGTWHISARQARKKDQEALETKLTGIIEGYRDELRNKMDNFSNEMSSLRDEVTAVNANMQQQIALVELKIETLSERVEKHNNVVERTYQLESLTKSQEKRIDHIENSLLK